MANSAEQRLHIRTVFRSQVEVRINDNDALRAHTYDVSDGGAFISFLGEQISHFSMNQEVSVQVLDVPIPTPIVKAKVVRINSNGIGLEFIFD